MSDFAQSVALSAAAALTWAVLWRVTLGAFGFPIIPHTAEARAICRRRKFEIGKTRYVVFFGILGYGFAFGLAMSVPEVTIPGAGWIVTLKFLLGALFFGIWMGVRSWNDDFARS